MGKMYTFDSKLLTDTPEVRIGEKLFAVDNRFKTVKKAIKIFDETKDQENIERMGDFFDLAFGKKSQEIDFEEMPFNAVLKLMEMALSAMTGEEPDREKSGSTG